MLEIKFPWRKNQAIFRKHFWQDIFYMFFNFFIFSLIFYNAFSEIGVHFFNQALASLGLKNKVAIELSNLPKIVQLLALFILNDFIQWNVHRMLHKIPFLWQFHQLHHSIEQMGFAGHLRFHWAETIVYKSILYIPMAFIGFSVQDFFVVHIFALCIGHLNHSNLNLSYGLLKYIFNQPKMHIWHHAKNLPDGKCGVNFGISLSIWDYLFHTAYIPYDGRDITLGFKNIKAYPQNIFNQMLKPFSKY